MNVDKGRSATPDRIVETATGLFWQCGYHAVSTDAICKSAGVSKSSLYHAFPSKEEIALEALARVWRDNWDEIRSIYDGDGDALTKLKAHLDWFVTSQRRLQEKYGNVLGTFNMALGVSVPERIRDIMRDHQIEHGRRIGDSVRAALGVGGSGEDAGWLVDIVDHALAGALIRARLTDEMSPLEAIPGAILRMIESYKGGSAAGRKVP